MEYQSMNKNELTALHQQLQAKYDEIKAMGLKLNMARGKPGVEQLELSMPMLDVLSSTASLTDSNGDDCRNYGMATACPRCRLCLTAFEHAGRAGDCGRQLQPEHDVCTISCAMTHGFSGCEPWSRPGECKVFVPRPRL